MKKKLLFLTVAFDKGGTEKVTFDIISHLNPEKYDITLMTMYNGGFFQDNLPEYVKVKYFFPRFMRFVIRYVTLMPGKLVYKTFIHDKYDVEIACGDDIPSRVINHSTNKNSLKVSWIHMDVEKRGYQGYEIKSKRGRKRFYENFDNIINVSYECEKKFKKKFGEKLPTTVIYNPIDTDQIILKSKEKPMVQLPKGKFNILCIGRFTPQKGFDRIVEAYYELKKQGDYNCRITILGEGYEKDKIKKMIIDRNLGDDIKLIGYVDNPYSIINQADLFLLGSRDESFSLVVAEALVLGIPVLSTKCTGPNELIQNMVNGVLVENNTEGIKEGLQLFLDNPTLCENIRKKSSNACNKFNIDKQIKLIEDIFDRKQ